MNGNLCRCQEVKEYESKSHESSIHQTDVDAGTVAIYWASLARVFHLLTNALIFPEHFQSFQDEFTSLILAS